MRPPTRLPRVLHVVSHLALGGAERVALTLIKSLRSEYEGAVYAVRGLADGDTGRALERELAAQGVLLMCGRRIGMRFGGMVISGFGLAKAVRQFEPDIIHLHTEIPEAAYAVMTAVYPSFRHIPVVRTIHNAVFWDFAPPLARWCNRRLAGAYCAAVSQGAADALAALRRRTGAAPPPEPTILIRNGLPLPETTRRAPREVGAQIELGFGGRLEPQKGADLLPAVLAQTRLPAGRTARLRVFGSGDLAGVVLALADQPPAGWTVELHAPVADFRQRLREFDLLLLPSRFEGLPLVAIEAALAGLPIVATRAPGTVEALPGDHPWMARPGDAVDYARVLTTALADEPSWPTAAVAAREFAEARFTADVMAAGYRDLYQRVWAKR
ncbi:glycosyltransferase [Synoicihabitans lomoniglobus]|uniref:Glycosyltransferase n=2 Tax=Synoicihabitans lomoniglobus TaxID=2909285 RepID=A0AAE9ZW61_9BACT|nr:glycosyltransferase [Opitutaceae bacterium LMO-M01]